MQKKAGCPRQSAKNFFTSLLHHAALQTKRLSLLRLLFDAEHLPEKEAHQLVALDHDDFHHAALLFLENKFC